MRYPVFALVSFLRQFGDLLLPEPSFSLLTFVGRQQFADKFETDCMFLFANAFRFLFKTSICFNRTDLFVSLFCFSIGGERECARTLTVLRFLFRVDCQGRNNPHKNSKGFPQSQTALQNQSYIEHFRALKRL